MCLDFVNHAVKFFSKTISLYSLSCFRDPIDCEPEMDNAKTVLLNVE